MGFIYAFFYDALVKSGAFLLTGIGNAIKWLSNPKLLDNLFGVSNGHYDKGKMFLIFIGLAVVLGILGFLIVILGKMWGAKNELEGWAIGRNIMLFFVMIIVIGFMFFLINYTIGLIMNLLNKGQPWNGYLFANEVARCGWTDGRDHSGWTYGMHPNWDNYSITIAALSIWATLIIFFLLVFVLVKRLFLLFTYYAISPLIFMRSATTDNWEPCFKWRDAIASAFLVSLSVIVVFQIYMIIVPKMMFYLDSTKGLDTATRIVLKIGITVGGAISIWGMIHELGNLLISSSMNARDSVAMAKGTYIKTSRATRNMWGRRTQRGVSYTKSGNEAFKKTTTMRKGKGISGLMTHPSAIGKISSIIKNLKK